MSNTSGTADIGLIGLAVMGQNLVLNMNDHGYTVAVFNRTTSKVDDFLAQEAKGTKVIGTHSLEELVKTLKRPRRVFMLVKAGAAVDALIDSLLPLLEKGDIIIDGGNSHFPDTVRRTELVESKGLLYVGTGVSGGEEGARHGPSIMPGGSPDAWPHVKELFQAISAKTPEGEPCCDWVGEDGAGHYVKMVHNGIEYGDMQLISESYHLMKAGPRDVQRGDAPGLRGVERGRARLLPHRDHPRHPGHQGRGGTPRPRPHPRHRRPEGHRQVDGDLRRQPRGAHDPGRRGGLRPGPLGPQGRARRRGEGPDRARGVLRGRQDRLRRGHPPGHVRLEDRLLRPGLHAHARGGAGARLEPELRRHRPHVARAAASSAAASSARSATPSPRTRP